MPLGGRTPDSPQPHTPGPSGPAPTDSGVCAISPSDLVGYTGNLINRVNELEQRIAELEAGNIEVNQLSDLSQRIGWVDGITYMGVEGWTQTSYGTLIPPPGFTFLGNGLTLSDGSTYQAVVMDEDGVLQFGFGQTTSDGTFTPITGAIAPGKFASIKNTTTPIIAATTGNNTVVPALTIQSNTDNLVSMVGSDTFNVNVSGYYEVSVTASISVTAPTILSSASITMNNSGNSNSNDIYPGGPNIVVNIAASTTFSSSRIMYFTAGSDHSFSAGTTSITTTIAINSLQCHMFLLKAA